MNCPNGCGLMVDASSKTGDGVLVVCMICGLGIQDRSRIMPNDEKQYLAYLRVRRLDTRECVHSVGLSALDHRYVAKVMAGMLINMDTENFFIDDSEVDQARTNKKDLLL